METSRKIRTGIIITLVILVIIFLIQNSAMVEVKLLFWPISIPRSLLIIVSIGIGALGNYIFMMRRMDKPGGLKTNRKKDKE